MLSRRSTLAALASLPALGCRREPTTAPGRSTTPGLLVLANIHTNDPQRPRAEALLVRDGAIVAVGDRSELAREAGGATVLDWRDATVIPGLTDAHAHLLGLGASRDIIDLRGAGSIDEVVARLIEQAPAEGWIVGRGWDQNLWGGAMPTAAALDQAFGDRPVWLERIDGHAGWANSVALRLAGIDASTADPEGGEILRDPASKQPTGVLVDAAMDRIPVPAASLADVERWLMTATNEAAALGLTGVHEMGLGPDAHRVFEQFEREGRLPIRVHGYASEGWFVAEQASIKPSPRYPEAHYLLAGVKLYADGALGSRGAALLEPYSDRPDHRGALMHEPERFAELVAAIAGNTLQIATHAIGDRGIRTIIDAYAQALPPPIPALRPRIEHVQVINLADIPRMAELGLVASMQPTHATSDMAWVPARVGPERVAGAYAWRRMLDAGIPLAFGSDFPVEQPSPLLGLYAAVTRQDLSGQPEGGWLPDQRLSAAEAIAAFSSGAAFAAGRERELGRLAPGFRADLTCLAGDPLAVDPAELPDLKVRATMVDGGLTYEA